MLSSPEPKDPTGLELWYNNRSLMYFDAKLAIIHKLTKVF